MLWRAFDKATWREPRGFAADADPMQIELRGELASECAGTVWRSTADDTVRLEGDYCEKML